MSSDSTDAPNLIALFIEDIWIKTNLIVLYGRTQILRKERLQPCACMGGRGRGAIHCKHAASL